MSDLSDSYNIAELLTQAAMMAPDRDALVAVSGGDPQRGIHYERVTYRELERRVEALAAALRSHGFRAGERVIVFVPMSISLYVVMLALLRAGGTVLFLDPWCSPQQMAHCCRLADPTWFVSVPRGFLFLLKHPSLRSVANRIATHRFPLGPRLTVGRLIGEGGSDTSCLPRNASDTAMVTFTSGTTGNPKGADRTHGFLRAQHDVLNESFGYRTEDVDLATFPVFTLNSLASGMTAVLPRMDFRQPAKADPAWILSQLENCHVTTTVGSPAFFESVCRGAVALGRTCLNVRAAFTGGGPVDSQTLRLMQQTFPEAEVAVAYGSTEAEPIAHMLADEVLATEACTANGEGLCVGKPIEAIQTRLVEPRDGPLEDEHVTAIQDGHVGELLVAGAHVCQAYYHDVEATRLNKWQDKAGRVWHRTGDLARCDAEGRLWLMGRLSARVKRHDATYYPGCIDVAIKAVEGVRDAACVGIPEAALGMALHVCWIPENANDRDVCVARIRQLAARQGWPLDGLHRVAAIPKDARHNTKVDRRALGSIVMNGKDM